MRALRIVFGLCSGAAVLVIAGTLVLYAWQAYGSAPADAAAVIAPVTLFAVFRVSAAAYVARVWSARSLVCWTVVLAVAAFVAWEAVMFASYAERARGAVDASAESAARDASRASERIAQINVQLSAISTIRTADRIAPEAEQARRVAPVAACNARPHVDSCRRAAELDAELAEAKRRDALEIERAGLAIRRDEATTTARPADTQSRIVAEALGVSPDAARRILGLALYLLLEAVALGGAALAARPVVPAVPSPDARLPPARARRETPLRSGAAPPGDTAIARNLYDVLTDIARGATPEPSATVQGDRVYVSVAALARLAGMSRPTCTKRLAALESGGRIRSGKDKRGAWHEPVKVAVATHPAPRLSS